MNIEIMTYPIDGYATKEKFNEPFDEYGRKPHAVFCKNLSLFGKGYHAN